MNVPALRKLIGVLAVDRRAKDIKYAPKRFLADRN